MLTVLYGESADLLAHIVRFYAPTAPTLLDITHGRGTLTKKLTIPVVGVDKDPTSRATIIADLGNLPLDADSFRLACFDPPYLYGVQAMHMGPVGQKAWNSSRSTLKVPADFVKLAADAARELARVLIVGGLVIIKVMDSRFKGQLVRNHDICIAAFEQCGFRLHDVLIYIRTVTGSFTNTKSAQSAHGYYIIMECNAP